MKNETNDVGLSFNDSFKRATSQIAVLKLLSEKSMYAYQMSAELKKRSDNAYTVAFLYPVINKLQSSGYVVEISKQVSEANRVRINYGITEKGRERLACLLHEFDYMVGMFRDNILNNNGTSGEKNDDNDDANPGQVQQWG